MLSLTARIIPGSEMEAAVRLYSAEVLRQKNMPSDQVQRHIANWAEQGHIQTGIFDVDGGILATAGLVKSVGSPEDGLGLLVSVATDFRHRREGLGRAVVGFVEDLARDFGVRDLRVKSTASGLPFYEELGYQKYHQIDKHYVRHKAL